MNNLPLVSSVLIFFFFLLPLLALALLWARDMNPLFLLPFGLIIFLLAIILPVLNYLQLSSYPQHMNIFLFSTVLSSQPTANIWVDVVDDDGTRMNCAKALASSLEAKGIKTKIYVPMIVFSSHISLLLS